MTQQQGLQASGNGGATIPFNVIFHGPFVFTFYEQRVEVSTPKAEDHSYGAGSWKSENSIEEGVYYLTGVKSESLTGPDPSFHICIEAQSVTIDTVDQAYCTFVLPTPSWIKPLGFVGPWAKSMFTGANAGTITATQLGSAHVCHYELAQSEWPQCEDAQWMPAQAAGSPPNFHIFAESEFMTSHDHPAMMFDELAAMLPNCGLGLQRPFVAELNFRLNCDPTLAGILQEEQGGLRGFPAGTTPPPCLNQPGVPGTNGPVAATFPPAMCCSPSLMVLHAKD